MGNVVEQSVIVFHEKRADSQKLSRELQEVSSLLHHFEDNVDDRNENDLRLARENSRDASDSVEALLLELRRGPFSAEGWSPEQRQQMASHFKRLFESCVTLMQLSEAQQARSFQRNIQATLDSLEQSCATRGRVAALHADNVRDACAVVARGARNRAEVAARGDEERKQRIVRWADIVEKEGRAFFDWTNAREDIPAGEQRRERAAPLRDALQHLHLDAEVRIGSRADFGYRSVERERWRRQMDALVDGAARNNKDDVVKAASELTAMVKQAEEDVGDEEGRELRKGARELLEEAKRAMLEKEEEEERRRRLKEAQEKMEKKVEKAAEKEEQIKGKPLKGQLPNAIQAMAQFLKSREAQQAKPATTHEGTSAAYGQKQPDAPQQKEEINASAPGYGLINQTKKW